MSSIALQLPKNYVEVTTNEMEYVDGGFAVSKNAVATAINLVIGAAAGGGAVANWLDAHDTYHNNGWIG